MFHFKVVGALAMMAVSCVGALATDGDLVRDTDKLHLDVRELINRTEATSRIVARVDLCARPEKGGAAICHPLASVGPADLPGKEKYQGSNIVKYPDGNQSSRVLGSEINGQGQRLREQAGPTATFRFVVTIEAGRAGEEFKVIRREYASLPSFDQEGPTSERGAIIERRQFDSDDKRFGGRVLVVLTRRN